MIPLFRQRFRPAMQAHVSGRAWFEEKRINYIRCYLPILILVLGVTLLFIPSAYATEHYYFDTRQAAEAACYADKTRRNEAPGYDGYWCRGPTNDTPTSHRIEEWYSCLGSFCGPDLQIAHFHYPISQCPIGQKFVAPGRCAAAAPEQNLGPGCNGKDIGNPCNAATGNKYHTETDFSGGEGIPTFSRHYNSQLFRADGLFGYNWMLSHQRRLEISDASVWVRQGMGRAESFTCPASGACAGSADNTLFLTKNTSDYTLIHRNGAVDNYDTAGRLSASTDPAGRTTFYSYDGASARLTGITGPYGHRLTLTHQLGVWIRLTEPVGHVTQYNFATVSNIVRFTDINFPDNTTKTYHYEHPTFPGHLTGISYVDSLGAVSRYATYAYDATGKAIRTEHAQTDNGSAQERFLLNYDSDTQTTVTDAIGTQEVMTFNANLGVKNLVSKVNQSDGKSVQQVFDLNNNLNCMKDEENRVTTYTYSATNQKLSMTEGLTGDCTNPANIPGTIRTTTHEYLSPTLDLPSFIRRPSVATGQTFETEMVYGDAGHPNLPTQIIQRGFTPSGTAVSRTVTLGYNDSGQVNLINGPRAPSDPGMNGLDDVITLEYYDCTTGGACGQLMRITNALGHITTYDLYDANGRLKQRTDPNGLVTAYTYDPRGRVKTITRTPTSGSAAITQYSYTAWGDMSQVIDPDGVVLNYQYDAAHDLRFIVDAAGNYIHYKYDLKGNRTGEDIYDAGGNLKRTMGYAYDLRNHLSSLTSAGNLTQLVHDAVGNLLSESPNADGVNRTKIHQYDALNRLFQTNDAVNGATPTGYGYDPNDRTTLATPPGKSGTQYTYDDLGNLLREASPDRGTTTYTHDAAGNVLSETNALGQVTTYTYDALNRATSQQSSGTATPRYTYLYDSCQKGQLCNIRRNGVFHMQFGYDGLGRRNYDVSSLSWLSMQYAYSPGGRISQLIYPTGRTVDYQYDALGRVSQVSTTQNGNTTVLASNIQYYPFGPLTYLNFGNGRALSNWVDTAYRPTVRFDGPYYQYITAYDGADNIRAISGNRSFTYDALSRLTEAVDPRAGSYENLSYLYDANGNRNSETRNGAPMLYIYDPEDSNRLYQAGGTDYRLSDAAGNTAWSSGLWLVGYDGYGRLLSSSKAQASYVYNAWHQRIQKTVGGVTTSFHHGPQGEVLYEAQGANTKAYVYLHGIPLARVDNDTNVYYYHTDHLGTPQQMTDSTGTTVWRALYEPFGRATLTTQTITNNLRYAGQYFDQETGLHYNWHRYYDPKVGRYISSDPIGLAGGLNTYLYARANPLRYIDPTGLETTIVCRPVEAAGAVGLSKPVHCSVIVWHWKEICGKKVRVIDAQFSLPGFARRPTTDPKNETYIDDRSAFNNPGGNNNLYDIPPPPGMSQSAFDQNVISSGNTYSQGPYWPTGPNSNTAAFDIIRNAGGTPPTVPGAWGQGYVPTPLPELPIMP